MKKLLTVNLIMLSFIALISCAGSKSNQTNEDPFPPQDDDYGEIEQLLGITPDDQNRSSQDSQDEDLISLLEDTNSGNETSTPAQPAEKNRVSQLEGEVTDLNRKLQEKNKTINILRNQVMAMEEEKDKPQRPSSSINTSFTPSANIADTDYQRRYQSALDMAHNKQYREAIRGFEALLASNDKNSLSDNAQYWIGECYYALGDYRAAILAFEKVFTFKDSNKNDYSQYKLGLCYFQLKDRERARQEFQSLLDNYDNSPLISKAQEYMAKL